MKKQIERRICDECAKVVDQSEMTFGGSPFNGWLEVIRTDGSTVFPRHGDSGPWHFCSKKCCVKFLNLADRISS